MGPVACTGTQVRPVCSIGVWVLLTKGPLGVPGEGAHGVLVPQMSLLGGTVKMS